jgi:hypothetical protein
MRSFALVGILFFTTTVAHAQYNAAAGQNAPTTRVDVAEKDEHGRAVHREVEKKAAADRYGNAAGNQNDLAIDGAFDGQTVVVLQFYTGEGFDFSLPRAALKEMGFSVYRFSNGAPAPETLRAALAKASQLWIISGERQLLGPKHLEAIQAFFDAGHGVYIWGDNQPYYADANYVGEKLLGARMLGDVPGDRVVGLQRDPAKRGLLRRHLLTTGLEFLYEGITIATIQGNQSLTPLLYGSADNLVAAFYDKAGKRAIFDGGFTRLYLKWDTAGTARYVKNSAAWLANVERFGALAKTGANP